MRAPDDPAGAVSSVAQINVDRSHVFSCFEGAQTVSPHTLIGGSTVCTPPSHSAVAEHLGSCLTTSSCLNVLSVLTPYSMSEVASLLAASVT